MAIYRPAEIQKAHQIRIRNGFYTTYMSGDKGLDIGFRGYNFPRAIPVLATAIGIDLDYPGYDGRILPFATQSMDYVFSSHALEHISDYIISIQEWYRVTKIGGYIIICVPHKYLAERKHQMPSLSMSDHKRFYTPSSLLREIEEALIPNSYRVELLRDCDDNYDYERVPPKIDKNFHWRDRFEIECVLRKIKKPDWDLI